MFLFEGFKSEIFTIIGCRVLRGKFIQGFPEVFEGRIFSYNLNGRQVYGRKKVLIVERYHDTTLQW